MREFTTLIIDILSDVKRRQGMTLGVTSKSMSMISDDEPLYDCVASDEDYASIGMWWHSSEKREKKCFNLVLFVLHVCAIIAL